MTEGVFPKADGDVLYASEVNIFYQIINPLLESINQSSIINANEELIDKSYLNISSDTFTIGSGYNHTIDTTTSTGTYGTGGSVYTAVSSTEATETDDTEYSTNATSKTLINTITFPYTKNISSASMFVKGAGEYNPGKFYIEYVHSDGTIDSIERTNNTATYQNTSFNPSMTAKPVSGVNVYAYISGSGLGTIYTSGLILHAFDYTNGFVQTISKTFNSNINSIFINANKVLNGSSTITVDVSSDSGSTWDIEDGALNTLLVLDGDNKEIVIKFNLNVYSGNTPEFYGYSYLTFT